MYKQKKLVVTLDDETINEAIISHINEMGLETEGKDIDVDITAGRGENGNSAKVTIITNGASKPAIVPERVTEKVAEPVAETPAKEEPVVEETSETADAEEPQSNGLFG